MARILVVEDEKDLQEVLAYNLRQAGHVADRRRQRPGRARPPSPSTAPICVLLDLMLPDVSGIEICRRAQERTRPRASIPIMMVTAKGDEVDRVVGFELGADDYVVKPFSVRELLLRIEAVLRRTRRRQRGRGARSAGVRQAARRSRRAPRLGRRRRGDADRARAAAALDAARTPRPRAVAPRAARRRLGHERRGDHAHRRHPRQAPAREAGQRRPLHRDRARRRLPFHARARSRIRGRQRTTTTTEP